MQQPVRCGYLFATELSFCRILVGMKQLSNLYPLRFVLALFVILFHLPEISNTLGLPNFNAWPLFHKGELAVYYFFSLSGFLILRLIYLEIRQTGDFRFRAFYKRRIQRLYPLYYLVLLIGILLYHLVLPLLQIPFPTPYHLMDLLGHYVLLIPNVFKYYHPELGGILVVMWSIGIEEQFYLFIPVFLYLFRRRLILCIAVLLALLLLLLFYWPDFYRYYNYYFYFLFGGLLAILAEQKTIRLFQQWWMHVLVYSLCLLSFATNWIQFTNGFLYHCMNMLLSGCLLTLIADYPVFTIKSRLLTYLGKISYGIYMYHMIVLTGLLFLVSRFGLWHYMPDSIFIVLLNIILIVLTCLIAHFSYQYFERIFYQERPLTSEPHTQRD